MNDPNENRQTLQPQPDVENQKRGMVDLPQRFDRYEPLAEVFAIIILAFATLATAWSGYQSARWSGVQAEDYSRASALRVESTRASTTAMQLTQIDIGLFTNWINAYAQDNQSLLKFYQTRFRPEFKPAFEAWLATDPKNNPDAPPSPFAMPEYQVAKNAESADLQTQAEQMFKAANDANEIADRYVLDTVILASVLFLAGLASQVKSLLMRTIVVIFAMLILIWGLYSIIILPIN
jgi:hypothetical protein